MEESYGKGLAGHTGIESSVEHAGVRVFLFCLMANHVFEKEGDDNDAYAK